VVLHDSLRAAELLTITAGKLRPKVEVDISSPIARCSAMKRRRHDQ
jgi:hypothetical protein